MASSIQFDHALLGTDHAIFDRLYTSTISSYNLIDTSNQIKLNQTLNNTFNSTLCTPLVDQQLQNPLVLFSVICMVIINLVVIFGNFLVILSVFLYTKLRTVTNLFILSLAVADLLLGLTVVPYSLTQTISKSWYFGRIWCMGWLVIDVWLSTASILNLVAISVDRYLAITKPLKYRTMMTAKRAKILIASAWIVSFLICFPPLVHTGWNQAGTGLIEVNITQKINLNSNSINTYSSFHLSSNLSSNQHSSNSSKQTSTNTIELNRSSSSFLNGYKFFHNSVFSQRNKRDRYASEVVTSAPLIANLKDPDLIWWSDNLKHDSRERIRTKFKTNVEMQLKIEKKNRLQNLNSKYKQLHQRNRASKQNETYKHLKRWRRSDEPIESRLIMDCDYKVLQCVLFDSKGYVIYSAVGSFFIPMIIMIFFYWRIYLVAMYTTKAMNRGYISKKSIRINPMAVFFTGSTKNQAADSLTTTIKPGLSTANNAINVDANSDANSNLTLRVHRGYVKDQQLTANLINDLNRRSTNRSSYDSSGGSGRNSTSTTITVRANSTIETTTAAQLCRRLLPSRLSNRLLSNNDAKQLRKIQHRSVRCLDRTQNIVSLSIAADTSAKPRSTLLKRTQSELGIELSTTKIDENSKNKLSIEEAQDKSNGKFEKAVERIDRDQAASDKNEDKQVRNVKNSKPNYVSPIRISSSEKDITKFKIKLKRFSLSTSNLPADKVDYKKMTFNLTKDAQVNSAQTGSQIKLCIVPPLEDKQNANQQKTIDHQNGKELEKPSQSQNGYSNIHEINNNQSKDSNLIETIDTSCNSDLIQSPLPSTLSTSGSTRNTYWSKFSRKKTYLNKSPNQTTNNSGRFEKKRFLAETKAAKRVGIIVGCFWLCWFPFFTVYLTRGLCDDKNCIPDIMLTLFTWLGYINSALNPIIYGCFSKDFRRAFKNIICKCKFSEETGISTLIRQIHLPNLFEEDMI